MFGYLLDGYPPSREDLDNLRTHDVIPDLVLYLECSDATAIARQVSRAARSTDTTDKARERLAVFHRAGTSFDTLATDWFPDSMVVRLDAEQSPQTVEQVARSTIENMFGSPERTHSFFPIPPVNAEAVASTRVHFHVDARDASALREIARRIYTRDKRAQGQLKIYPIGSLHLGPQISRLPIYQQLPNFHTITDAADEAFITGFLGDGDLALMPAVLEATRAVGGMAELEEYVGEWTLQPDGTVVEDSRYPLLGLDLSALAPFAANLCRDIPTWELHHGFDLLKTSNELPLSLAELTAACAAGGLENGGWFVFKKDDVWAYRTNEFSSGELASEIDRLAAQARTLREILGTEHLEVPIGSSLEKVHAMWTW
jgi:hypothetical protein